MVNDFLRPLFEKLHIAFFPPPTCDTYTLLTALKNLFRFLLAPEASPFDYVTLSLMGLTHTECRFFKIPDHPPLIKIPLRAGPLYLVFCFVLLRSFFFETPPLS